MSSTPEWIEWMLEPSFYPERPSSVSLVQTHISWVFVADDYVYKVKKPVDFGFLDFTTLEKRKHFVHEELRLNKRLCPEIYLECIPLVRTQKGGFRLGANGGQAIEWVLKMKRMPEDGMMQRLIKREELDEHHLDLLVGRLAPFYEAAETGGWVDEYGSIDKIRFNIEENFGQTAPFLDDILERDKYDFIRQYNEEFFRENSDLFARRVAQHRIREGHGDLYSANICFDGERDQVYCFDCIEFNERFRCGDVACDLGFLAMDLDFHGLPWMEQYFVKGFVQAAHDPELMSLMDFYKCYRAYVRAKIGCFMANDPGLPVETREQAKLDAQDYFSLSFRYAGGMKGLSPVVYCFMGLSGTGKSSLARDFSEKMGLNSFSSDIIRKEVICGIPREEHHVEPFGEGIYQRDITEKTYAALRRNAAREVLMGRSLVLDATYIDPDERKRLMELEAHVPCRVLFIQCELEDEIVKKRLKDRLKASDEPSDGRYEIYLEQKKAFVPFDADTFMKRVVVIDTRNSREENLATLLRILEAKGI